MAYSELLCTDLASVEAARDLGADRIELCSALEVGGLTPGVGLLHEALRVAAAGERQGAPGVSPLEIVVLARPREGDFVYDEGDFRALLGDVEAARDAGAAGVALGVMLESGEIDRERTAQLIAAARPLLVTFHRAIDRAAGLIAAAEVAVDLGVDRILTSGGARSAWEGRESLRRLSATLGGRVEIVAAAGVTGASAGELIAATGVHAIHGSCSRRVGESTGGGVGAFDGRRTLDVASAARFVEAARAGGPGRG